MEGAGASNVSHAAETREMDSADEEPELPSAVQKLILRLEGEGKPTRWLPQLTKEEFRDFFPPPELLSTISGWRSQVRLRILEAIGNCNRFEFLNFRAICGYKGSISTLNACEWEVLLRAFRDSTVLQEIIIPGLEVSSDDEWESLCFQIGRILNTSSVQVLRIDSTNLSARCFLNLASGLRGNSDSKLQALKLESARIDSSAVKHVADMINSATRLESLIIDSIDDMEEENVRILSQALMKSSSLKTLTLLNMKWGEALLLNAFAGDDRNRSIERLVLGRWERLGDRSCELLTSNPSLKEVTLSYLKMRPEEWHQVGEVIRDKAGATNITVQFGLQQDVREEWESIEALAFAASSDVQDPRLALQMVHHSDQGSCEHGFMLSMNLLGRVLRGDIKSLKSLRIWANFITSGTNQDRLESILSMNGKTGETSVLKRLALHILNRDLHKGLWKDLLGCLRGNTSLTHLQLYIPKVDGEEAFRDLMGLLEVNLTLQEIDVRGTSWIMEGKEAQIQEALKQNQKRAVYMSEFRKAKLTFGDAKAGRLFLCGSPRAVYIPNLDYIIVDPNWLTNTLLGELVAIGQNFQAQELGSSDKTMSRDSYTSKDGFVSESVFAGLIEEFLLNQPHVERGVDRETLENILINLDLCFKLEDTSQYFIPSFIREHASMEDQKHQVAEMESMAWKTRDETSQFVGIRIQCADGRTMSMTAAFFPCFQMFMRRKLISEMHVSKEMVTCSRHYLRLFLDGHQIYVQQGKSHKYVDVLMLCSKHKSREGALKYVMKHIVHELISFCASPKGCPGVALMLGVIQTLCVEMLIPSDLRGTILIEELKSKFIRSIKDKLEDLPLDKLQLEKEEELFNYEHSWPLIEGYTTQVIFERARDLLWESDVEAVVNEIREKQMQHLESLQQALIKQLENLQQGLIKVNNDLIHSYPENENVVTSSNFLDMKDSNRPSSRCLSRASTSVENRSAQRILSKFDQLGQKFDQLGQKVDGLDERLRSMESIVKRLDIKLGQILSLQQQLQFKLSAFMSKVDRFIQYSYSLQQARTPKRPYVTDDVGIFYRISALLHVGTTIRLHLMCESATGFHPVKDQEGLKIRLDRENCQWIRKTIEISFKIMYYAAKAGLEKTLGLGQAIPDWEDLKSDIVKLDGISDRDRRAVLKGGESKELKEAWLRIQQTLAPQLQDSYSAIFKLYQVKYVSLELGGHAWVCEECMNKVFKMCWRQLSSPGLRNTRCALLERQALDERNTAVPGRLQKRKQT
ncbi:hypothetical protein AXG93_4875s1560 [Marchantia polymorpha subsp. ruderalis]|uniref:C-terminal of Roc (COR) domain-containing protein n=1 Tax=Marchantia polymorpha subsp. ruderalis TaxID=1480154 RepID=A0A176WQ57_MARPO|nr:hypothetical protein AXG93_4875s1560 [Marchantia polymorpha subsp. ruderalis]